MFPSILHNKLLFLQLHNQHRRQLALFYLTCFLAVYAWFAWHGLLLSVVQPVFFLNRLDYIHNVLMISGLQQVLLHAQWLRLTFDLLFLFLPIGLTWSCWFNKRGQVIWAIGTAVFHAVYLSFFSSMTFVSVENFLAWMLVPLLFSSRSVLGFYLRIHSLRFLFALFFFSAFLWKIKGGGLFHGEEMSAILLSQHSSVLAGSPNNWYSKLILFLIRHETLSVLLYWAGALAEGVFALAFFSKRFDKWLILAFCGFVVFDYLLMGINYFTWMPFMGCFYFSRYGLPERD